MDTLVAHFLIGGDEHGFMHDSTDDRPDICPICKNRIKDVPNPNYKLKSRRNMVTTYDHYTIVSEQFREFCLSNGYANIHFTELIKCKGYYIIDVEKVCYLDEKRGHTQFIRHRNCCGSYDEVISPSMYLSKENNFLSNDFICRSYYSYGSFYYKLYKIIIGLETKQKMIKANLKGIYYGNIFQ